MKSPFVKWGSTFLKKDWYPFLFAGWYGENFRKLWVSHFSVYLSWAAISLNIFQAWTLEIGLRFPSIPRSLEEEIGPSGSGFYVQRCSPKAGRTETFREKPLLTPPGFILPHHDLFSDTILLKWILATFETLNFRIVQTVAQLNHSGFPK